MTYDGWLKFGGTEIANNPRAFGYARTAGCAGWLVYSGCDTLEDALGDLAYVYSNVTEAPWYDSANPEVSSRFYGVYITDLSGIEDSTRQVQTVESAGSGGLVGHTRRAMKRARVRATLLARGDDAMEYGRAWLDRVLSETACGQHGARCGTTDLEFLASCPPVRECHPGFSPWVDVVRNRMENPSMERVLAGSTIMRRNLHPNPNPASTFGYTAGGALAGSFAYREENSESFVHAEAGSTAAYAISGTPDSTLAVRPGEVYTLSVDVRGAETRQAWIRVTYSSGQATSVPVTLSDDWQRISLTVTVPSGVTSLRPDVYVNTNTSGGATGDYLDVRRWLIESNPAPAFPFFAGDTDSANTGIAYAWAGLPHQSISTAAASYVEYRRNYAERPNGYQAMSGYGSQTITAGVAVTDHPQKRAAANRVAYTTGQSNPGVLFSSGLPAGTYTFGAWVKVESQAASTRYGLAVFNVASEGARALTTGVWTWVQWTQTIAASGLVGFRANPTTGGDGAFLITGVQVELGGVLGPYFDGAITPDADMTQRWLGTPDASQSVLQATRLDKYNAGTGRVAYLSLLNGYPALRLLSQPYGGDAQQGTFNVAIEGAVLGQTYTAIATATVTAVNPSPSTNPFARTIYYLSGSNQRSEKIPNEVGTYEIRFTFTLDGTEIGPRLAGDTTADFSWDDLIVVEGADYQGGYFDGSTTSDDDLRRYVWTGTPNASASIQQEREAICTPYTDEEYEEIQVAPLRRFMHDVAAVEGPFRTNIAESGGIVMHEVEWGFVSERPYVFSGARTLDLPSYPSTVVDDVASNLVPYPSAEIAGGDTVLATNYATNPSVEVDATGYVSAANAISGTNPLAYQTGARVTEKAGVGAASYRTRLLGPASGITAGSQARVYAQYDAPISALNPASDRISAHLWAAVTVAGTGTSIQRVRTFVEFRNGTTIVGTVDMDDLDPAEYTNGGEVSKSGIPIPAGATVARVSVVAEVTWQNSSDVRVYVDKITVSKP